MEPSLETQQQYHYNTAAGCRYSSGRARGEEGGGGGEKVGRVVGRVWELLILVAVPDGAQFSPRPQQREKVVLLSLPAHQSNSNFPSEQSFAAALDSELYTANKAGQEPATHLLQDGMTSLYHFLLWGGKLQRGDNLCGL